MSDYETSVGEHYGSEMQCHVPLQALQDLGLEPGATLEWATIDDRVVGVPVDVDADGLEANWPYEYVEPGEVTQEMTWLEAKSLRQELERVRKTLDEWACDRCGENMQTATKGLDGPGLCNDCIFGEDDDE